MLNCIIIEDDILSKNVLESFITKTDFLNTVAYFPDALKALSFLKDNSVDLIFSDIEMPEMSGIEFISLIQQNMPQVILTTSHDEFAVQAFEYNVTDYLVKPFDYTRFYKAALKAKTIHNRQNFHTTSEDFVFIKKGSSILRINKKEILWVEALGDYVVLNTANEKFVMYSTMKEMEVKLASQDYMRVHRSFIVRIDAIDTVEDNTISFHKKLIPIGRSYRSKVYKRLSHL